MKFLVAREPIQHVDNCSGAADSDRRRGEDDRYSEAWRGWALLCLSWDAGAVEIANLRLSGKLWRDGDVRELFMVEGRRGF